ncbi:MAG: extracellular solute-binding protein [Lachnospiraceae bacterium]|nr:extracellular solute-binding protein [Lachnospiraceae bacterium]
MRKKNLLALGLAAVLLGGLFAGCGNGAATETTTTNDTTTEEADSTDQEEPADTTNGEQINLRFSWWGGESRHEATLAVIEAFEAEHPNITITPEFSSIDGYAARLTTQFASRTAPDIIQVETGLGSEYQRQGVLKNLSETDFDFSNFDESFLEIAKFGTDSYWAIPTGMGGSALIVNQDLADAAGVPITEPHEWEDWFEWGRLVREYDPEAYLLSASTPLAYAFIIRAMARQMTGEAIVDRDFNLTLTEAQFEEIFDFIRRLYEEEVAAPASYLAPFGEQLQQDPNWVAGRYVAAMGYSSSIEVFTAAAPDVTFANGRLPLLPDRANDGWVTEPPQFIGIYYYSEHPEEAAKFLNFFFNNAESVRTLGLVRSIPPTAFAQEIIEGEGLLDPLMMESVEISLSYNGFSDGGPTTSAEVRAILESAFEDIAFGTLTPADAAARTVQQIEDFIAANSN